MDRKIIMKPGIQIVSVFDRIELMINDEKYSISASMSANGAEELGQRLLSLARDVRRFQGNTREALDLLTTEERKQIEALAESAGCTPEMYVVSVLRENAQKRTMRKKK